MAGTRAGRRERPKSRCRGGLYSLQGSGTGVGGREFGESGAERADAQVPARDVSIPGHGKGKGPAGYKLFGGGKLAFQRQMTQETVGRAGAMAAPAVERSSRGGKLPPPRNKGGTAGGQGSRRPVRVGADDG